MPQHSILWCSTHQSPALEGADEDPDSFWLCEKSNLSAGREDCELVTAQVRWKAD